MPDINFTPPLEFPSDGVHVKIVQATDASSNNSTNLPFLDFGNSDSMPSNESVRRLQEDLKRRLNENVVKFPSNSQPINVIAKISENFTENKYYNNHIESNWRLNVTNVMFTLIILTILSISVLACSALCLKKVEK